MPLSGTILPSDRKLWVLMMDGLFFGRLIGLSGTVRQKMWQNSDGWWDLVW